MVTIEINWVNDVFGMWMHDSFFTKLGQFVNVIFCSLVSVLMFGFNANLAF